MLSHLSSRRETAHNEESILRVPALVFPLSSHDSHRRLTINGPLTEVDSVSNFREPKPIYFRSQESLPQCFARQIFAPFSRIFFPQVPIHSSSVVALPSPQDLICPNSFHLNGRGAANWVRSSQASLLSHSISARIEWMWTCLFISHTFQSLNSISPPWGKRPLQQKWSDVHWKYFCWRPPLVFFVFRASLDLIRKPSPLRIMHTLDGI